MGNEIKKVAVFTSGGDAPGMNACIRAVVRTAHYHKLQIWGIKRGYQGMIEGDFVKMNPSSVGNIIQRGGTILKTARSEEFRTKEGRKKAYDQLKAKGIEGIIAIGGNGTFTGATIFYEEYGIPCIGAPGTIDNDLFGTDLTIGFDTAVNTAVEAVDKIRDTADSHNRLFFVEVMGRDAGFIGLNTGIASGATTIFLPETYNDQEDLVRLLEENATRKKLFGIIIVSEGNKNGGATEWAKFVKERLPQYEAKVTIIGHLQRGGSPTALDRVLASRLGYSAVEGLLEGKYNQMIGQIDGKMIYTSFRDAIEKKKPINKEWLEVAKILAR